MIDKEVISYLKPAHGSYNMLIALLFVYQGILGLKIRRQRLKGQQQFTIIKRHRRLGPFLVLLGLSGFFAGLILVYLDTGRFIKYPFHFATGSTIALSIITAFFISRKIRGRDSLWRDVHFMLGIFILCLYIMQVFLGLGILL